MKERKEKFLARPREDVSIRSRDGLRLRGTYIPNGDEKKIVICFHGYTSQGMSDYIGLSDYYLRHGFSMLLPDAELMEEVKARISDSDVWTGMMPSAGFAG